MLEVKGLMVFYENALAVNDLSLKVQAGQVMGVIGSNSAGKTTLMNTLSGLILDQRPDSTVLENLAIAGHLRSRVEVAQTTELCFDLFPNLTRWRSRKARFLSGGEQQMLAIGMALVVRPRLLLLDEPLLGLSPAMQEKVVEAIRSVREKTGVTIVIAEQFARPILPMLDFGYVIENGMLTLTGSGRDLMENPEVKSAYFGL
ncbi:MAG: ATP-binding cassette domain-containing protein [Desulfarculus sp.]|nr:ATP-binding cassette domain-containing protein [Desulfarculus sp.]